MHVILGSQQKSALSPYQTKAAPHWLRSYIFNGYRRISGEVLFFGIPLAIGAYHLALVTLVYCLTKNRFLGYGVYTWAKSYDEYQNSKAGHLASGGVHHE